jgi:hypothetical protein
VRFGAFRKLGRCGLLRRVLPKQQDFSRPLTQSLRDTICESSICRLIACSVCRERAFLRECGFRAHTSPPGVAKRQAKRSRAMRPRWLAWAAFIFGLLWPLIFADQGPTRIRKESITRCEAAARVSPGSKFLIIRFPFAILEIQFGQNSEDSGGHFRERATMRPKKISFAFVFRRRHEASTSDSRLVSRSRLEASFHPR